MWGTEYVVWGTRYVVRGSGYVVMVLDMWCGVDTGKVVLSIAVLC